MADDSLMGELYGILLDGLGEGDERALDKLYSKYDTAFPSELEQDTQSKLKSTLDRLLGDVGGAVEGPLASRPHFAMLFAAVAHREVGTPAGLVDAMPNRDEPALQDPVTAIANLLRLAEIIESDAPPKNDEAKLFWQAPRAATVRVASRRARFPFF